MQEVTMSLAMILQKFDCKFADPSYDLQLVQTLTLKPTNLFIHAVPRKHMVGPVI